MSLQDAAAAPDPEERQERAQRRPGASQGASPGGFWRKAAERTWQGYGFDPPPGFEDRWGRAKARETRWRRTDDDKRRWRAAYEAARQRGLDQEEQAAEATPKRRPQQNRARSNRRMNPFQHARALLRETSLPLAEIAAITRLSIYQVVGLKLKMREEAGEARRARA